MRVQLTCDAARACMRTPPRVRVRVCADRAWNVNNNGVKQETAGARSGFFGSINLLAPRSAGGYNPGGHWRESVTFSELAFTFLLHAPDLNGTALPLRKAFISFFDMDTSGAGVTEALQIRGASTVSLSDNTEIRISQPSALGLSRPDYASFWPDE